MYEKVTSSNIDALKYDNGKLYVRFHSGSEYSYENVSEEQFEELRGAASIGRTFHALIKSRPEVHKVERVA